MDEKYWNRISQNYTDEIFSVIDHDSEGHVKKFLKSNKAHKKELIDFGCGIGHVIPLLAEHCRQVHAMDLSSKCLKIARQRHGTYENVRFLKADMTRKDLNLPKAQLAVAINSFIVPSMKKRLAMFKAVRKHLVKNGRFLMVVPSLESFLFSSYRLNEWQLREGESIRSSQRLIFGDKHGASLSKMLQGAVPIEGVMTKHYLKEELLALFKLVGFRINEIKKLKYPWKTEYHRPPRWMKEPYPWDWCCVAEKA